VEGLARARINLLFLGIALLEPDNASMPLARNGGRLRCYHFIISQQQRHTLCLLAASLRDRQVCYSPAATHQTNK